MNPRTRAFRLWLLLCSHLSLVTAQTPFSADSAAAFLRVIAGAIGARPMGSPAEQRAMEYGLSKFREFGLEARLMRMDVTGNERTGHKFNTQSGAALGILRGRTDRIIVIGGHIDSAAPEIPGANDDGSGSATVIELARILSRRSNQSTIVFCLFGGEEQGLRGSRFFVDNFPEIDRVVLMLQADMANGSDRLIPLVDVHGKSAPAWLVRATYEECTKLGYTGLSYPTHFLTLSNLSPGGALGSDHMPFLERGIPAIDISSDLDDPIHTPQDNLEMFKSSGLKRSGDLLYRMVERFDGGVPEEKTAQYYLFDIGQTPFFVPLRVLDVLLLLAVGAAGWSLFSLRKRRTETVRGTRPKVPAAKLFLLMLIIQIFAWYSPDVVSFVKGDRFPWLGNLMPYHVLGALAGFAGIWAALQISPLLRLSHDPYRWHLRAVIILTVFTVLFRFGGSAIALYPASALLLVSLAMLVRVWWLQYVFWLAAPYMMFRLAFSEGWSFMARSGVLHMPSLSVVQNAVANIVFILIFALWSFPFLLSFGAVHSDTRTRLIERFRSSTSGWILGGATAAWGVFLLFQPTFTDEWRQSIRIDQTVDLTEQTERGWLRSTEYLKGTRITVDGRDTLVDSRALEVPLFDRATADSSWIAVSRSTTPVVKDSTKRVDILLSLRLKFRPYTLTVSYSGAHHSVENISSMYAASTSSRTASFSWYSFPDSILTIPLRLTIHDDDTLSEIIEATFVQSAVSVHAYKPQANVVTRTVVRRTEKLFPKLE